MCMIWADGVGWYSKVSLLLQAVCLGAGTCNVLHDSVSSVLQGSAAFMHCSCNVIKYVPSAEYRLI